MEQGHRDGLCQETVRQWLVPVPMSFFAQECCVSYNKYKLYIESSGSTCELLFWGGSFVTSSNHLVTSNDSEALQHSTGLGLGH